MFFFTYTNYLTGGNDILKLQRYLQEAMTKRTGPNDAKRVAWAISTSFFFLIVFFKNSFLYTRTIGATVLWMDTQEATMRNHIIWTISTCFFSFCVFFFLFFY